MLDVRPKPGLREGVTPTKLTLPRLAEHPSLLVTRGWKDYALLDSGDGLKHGVIIFIINQQKATIAGRETV